LYWQRPNSLGSLSGDIATGQLKAKGILLEERRGEEAEQPVAADAASRSLGGAAETRR